jgi:hypothetical protein
MATATASPLEDTSHDDGALDYDDATEDWGDKDQEWLALLSCQVLEDDWAGMSNVNDNFWGKGPVGPDIRDGAITGYWSIKVL